MKILGCIVLATTLVGLFSFVGILLIGLRLDIKKITFYLISLASGTLLGGAFVHLIPEALEKNPATGLLWVAGGVLLFFVLEKLLIWRHCHAHQHPDDHSRPVAAQMILVGDTIHNFIDGVIIASAFLTSPAVGLSVTIAIVLHEIPQELGDFGTLVHGGFPYRKALLMNALTATAAILGGCVTFFFFSASSLVHLYAIPVAAGGFLYIALADLIPQLHDQVETRSTVKQVFLLLAGFSVIVLLRRLGV